MAWPGGHLGKLCALDLAAAVTLAAVILAHYPAAHSCVDPAAADSAGKPGFASLAQPGAAPACLRIRLP